MQWRFSLDGTLKEQPQGWDEIAVIIERDKEIRGLIVRYTSDLVWSGNGYDYIIGQMQSQGFCDLVDVLIEVEQFPENGWETFFEGVIFLSECKINRSWCTVEVKVHDAVFGAMIQNNKGIDGQVNVPRSKTDVTIFSAPNTPIDFFRPSDGAVVYMNRECYRVEDALKYIIEFMTDGAVGFTSTIFGTGGEWEDLVICTGRAIRQTAVESPPVISFTEIFTELHKRLNLSFAIEVIAGTPTVRIEYESYFYTATPLLNFRKIPDLEQSIKEELLYAKLLIGSNTTQESDGGTFAFPDMAFYAFKEESYHLVSTCNLKNELNLVGDWIVDSNVIEDVAVNGNDGYDDDIFLVETNGAVATRYDDFAPAAVYNKLLTNRFIAPRFLGAIPASIASFLGNGDDGFIATRTTATNHTVDPPVSEEPVEFGTEVSDPNGNYNNAAANYRYIAPADGFYKFRVRMAITNVVIDGFSSGDLRVTTYVRRFDTGSVFIEEKSQIDTISANGNWTLDFQPDGFYLDATDYVHVKVEFLQTGAGPDTIDFTIGTASRFESVEVFTGGGIFQTYNPEDVKIYKFDFNNYPLAFSDYKILEANTYNSANINTGDVVADDIEVYYDKAEYKPNGGAANFEMFSNESGL